MVFATVLLFVVQLQCSTLMLLLPPPRSSVAPSLIPIGRDRREGGRENGSILSGAVIGLAFDIVPLSGRLERKRRRLIDRNRWTDNSGA